MTSSRSLPRRCRAPLSGWRSSSSPQKQERGYSSRWVDNPHRVVVAVCNIPAVHSWRLHRRCSARLSWGEEEWGRQKAVLVVPRKPSTPTPSGEVASRGTWCSSRLLGASLSSRSRPRSDDIRHTYTGNSSSGFGSPDTGGPSVPGDSSPGHVLVPAC